MGLVSEEKGGMLIAVATATLIGATLLVLGPKRLVRDGEHGQEMGDMRSRRQGLLVASPPSDPACGLAILLCVLRRTLESSDPVDSSRVTSIRS